MKDTPKPDKRRSYYAAFRTGALRLTEQGRSTQAARALNTDPKRIHQWQEAAQTPVAVNLGTALNPAAELRQLRAANRWQAQELAILKKPSPASPRRRTNKLLPLRRCQARPLPRAAALPGAGRTGQRLVCLAEPLHGVVEPQAPAWETALVKAFRNPKRRYDTRRLQVILRQNGHRVGRQHLYAAMRRRDLHALQPKAGIPPATNSAHDLRCAPNRLLD